MGAAAGFGAAEEGGRVGAAAGAVFEADCASEVPLGEGFDQLYSR